MSALLERVSADQLLAEVEAELTERMTRSLRIFLEGVWRIIEPSQRFVGGFHIDAICEHVQAAHDRQIRNLLINVPPRFTKSTIVSVAFPAWEWTQAPGQRFLCASYNQSYSIRDAVKTRRIIQSGWYQARWGDVFQLLADQNQKSRYENDQAGHRISVSVGGGGTGEGGNYRITDDPIDLVNAYSEAALDEVIEWWDGVWSLRGMNPTTDVNIVIMQRCNQRDLSGHILDRMKEGGAAWEHLCLPMRYEPTTTVSTLGWSDPRTEEGELLCPERFDEQAVAQAEANLGPQKAAGQLQQRPAPAGGAIFRREWWDGRNRYDATDEGLWRRSVGRFLSYDTAFKEGASADCTACSVPEIMPDYRALLRHSWKERLTYPKLLAQIVDDVAYWNRDGKLKGILIEDKGSGTSCLQSLRLRFKGRPERKLLHGFNPKQSKEARAQAASDWCQKGCVWLPEPSEAVAWLLEFEESLFVFPGGAHDDDVDSFVQFILWFRNYLATGWRARQAA